MPYSDPLCSKCLHQQDLHSEVMSRPPGGPEIRRCIVGMCSCIVTADQKADKPRPAQAH